MWYQRDLVIKYCIREEPDSLLKHGIEDDGQMGACECQERLADLSCSLYHFFIDPAIGVQVSAGRSAKVLHKGVCSNITLHKLKKGRFLSCLSIHQLD